MKRIAYLLHRFPGITDTFIRREIRSLQKAGTDVSVISVWRPPKSETTPETIKEWAAGTDFILPRPIISILVTLLVALIRHPVRFLRVLHLAFSTSRPGLRGMLFQLFYFCEAVLAAEILRERKVDHVHNHIGDQSGIVTMLAAKLAGIEYSITFHGWPVFFDAKYSRINEKVRASHFIRAISYFCQSQLMMFSESDDPAPFKVVHCGLNIAKYRYRPPREQVKTLFCAARLSPEKGISFLIHALKALIDQGNALELRLAGNGPSRHQLEALVNELGVATRVKFLGFLNEDEIIGELQSADLFVLPSFVEGIPVSAMEAMAIGVPVIVTNIAGTSELIEDGRTGILVRPSDAEALIDAILRMIQDYPFRLRAAERGRQKVVDEFDVDRECAKLNEYLQAAAPDPRRRCMSEKAKT
jgi:glycosyltransferase involved in cell wall biosynthesis